MNNYAAEVRWNSAHTLLVITKENDTPSEWYLRNSARALMEMIRRQDRVGLQHLTFETRGLVDVFIPHVDPTRPKAAYCHPQLASYLNWYPSFILVKDSNYFDPNSNLEVRVFNRVIKDKAYKPGGKSYLPANLIMWVSEEMDDIEEITRPPTFSEEEGSMRYTDTDMGNDSAYTDVSEAHLLLEGPGVMVDTV